MKKSYQAKFELSDTGKIVHMTEEFTDLDEFHDMLRKNADHIAGLFNDYDFIASYIGDEEYEPGCEYNEEEYRYDFNLQTFNGWIEELIGTGSLSTVVTDAKIIERANDTSTSVYFQAEILNSYDESVIYTTSSYSRKEIVYEELRSEIDKIGKAIAEEVDDCHYLGDVEYKKGKEFNDHLQQWDFNKKTLSEWIECAIENGNYNGPIVRIFIETNKIIDKYVPKNVSADETKTFSNMNP